MRLITLLVATWCSILPLCAYAGKPDCAGFPQGCVPVKGDVDECALDPDICGDQLAICTNMRRGFHCECPDGYLPSPGINWKINVTVCAALDSILPTKKNKRFRVDKVLEMVRNMTSGGLPLKTVSLLLDELADDERERPVKHRHEVLLSKNKLVSKLVERTSTRASRNFSTKTTEGEILSIGPNASLTGFPQLRIPSADVYLDIDLESVAHKNNGSASVALVAYSDMQDILEVDLFSTAENTTKAIISKVVSATLEDVANTELSNLVNFTLRHINMSNIMGKLHCVYWNESAWIEDGCTVSKTNRTHTVCTCVHLSTFSLIMQTDDRAQDPALRLLSILLETLGLLILTLAVVTFALCRKNPQVSCPPRLHLSACLLLAHAFFLVVQTNHRMQEVPCGVLSVFVHYFYLCCFLWTSIEAAVLLLTARRLDLVTPDTQQLASWKYMYVIGYGVPLVIVGMSVGMKPDGYGSQQCWLSLTDGFIWSFLGPLFALLAVNTLLFTAIFIILQLSDCVMSEVRYVRGLAWRALFQSFMLGLPWLLGLSAPGNRSLEVLVILLHSQQAFGLFLVHCVFNTEVRKQYSKWCQKFRPSDDEPGFYGIAMDTEQDASGRRQRRFALSGER
ncbi:adhesion G protein-coupled receptor E3-like [Sardina pilchardus]|uniref:adhesion G protein-coupled receptor E3-like n=1 Tax=Sardina pilchardus TaxID=27697 RepID=UPI002E11CFD9